MRPASRSPAARLIRARTLSANWEQTRTTHSYEDSSVLAYAKFLYELDGLDGHKYDQYLALRPVMAELHYLLSGSPQVVVSAMPSIIGHTVEPQLDDRAAYKDRSLVRAFILGDAPPEEIGETLDLQPQVIRLYEHLAFDVRSRLKKRGWLHNFVFGDSILDATSIQDFDRLCLITVYRHGLAGLRRMLFIGQESYAEYTENLRQQLRVDMAAKASLSLMTMPLNSHTIPEIVTGYNQWEKTEQELQLKKEAGKTGGATNTMQAGLMESLQTAGFTVFDGAVDSEVSAEERQGDQAFLLALRQVMNEVGLEEKASV